FPEFKKYPSVYALMAKQIDMQFADARALMKLPASEVDPGAGCNLTTAATLCNLISGLSVVLFTPDKAVLTKELSAGKYRASGDRFKGLLKGYYPWQTDDNVAQTVDNVYKFVRNPLAHQLGVFKNPTLWIDKSPLKDSQLVEIETASARPTWIPKTY